jgi:hypothetical protein
VASIDTEEDNWQPTRQDVRVENAAELPGLHRFLRGLGLRPTYFVDHPVASDPRAAASLAELQAEGGAEIGAHLHPWNTPPVDEAMSPAHTMLRNLAPALQRAKLTTLCETLASVTGARPRAFRAGRFGLGPETVPLLVEAGFRVDSSVVPFVSWAGDAGADYVGAPVDAYWLEPGTRDLRHPGQPGGLRELPLSCGFTRRPFGWRSRLHASLRRGSLARLPLGGLMSRLGVARRVIVSPELETVDDMLTASRRLLEEGARALQIFWHSPSLVPGLSPFVQDAADRERLFANIAAYVEGVSRFADVVPATVSEAAEALLPDPAADGDRAASAAR